jgi:hypothetical protein
MMTKRREEKGNRGGSQHRPEKPAPDRLQQKCLEWELEMKAD